MPRYYTPRLWLRCQICSREFDVVASRIKSARFCSLRCKGIGSRQTMHEALIARTKRTEGCWLVKPDSAAGYGRVGYYDGTSDTQYVAAHHAAWIIASGAPVPDGHSICHVCDVRNCVRNDDEGTYTVDGVVCRRFGHLFLGTPRLNMLDRSEKGRARTPRGADCHLTRLTDDDVRELRRRYAQGGISQRGLAAEYGIHHTTLQSIIHRRTWDHVD